MSGRHSVTVGLRHAVLLHGLFQGGILRTCPAFHERRSKIGHESGIRPSFGYHRLPHIRYGIDIDMRKRADKPVRPVRRGKGDLLSGSELQAAVCPEMYEGVCSESVSGPQIGGHILMRRRLLSTVHCLISIVPISCGRLRHENDIPETDCSYAQTAVFRRQVTAGKFPVRRFHFGVFVRQQGVTDPGPAFFFRHHYRIAAGQKP